MTQMTKRLALLLCLLWLAAAPGGAQLEEGIRGLGDENVQGYLDPLHGALATTLNSAIFRSGHVPAAGFTFSIGAAAMAVGFADEDRVYVPTDPDGFTSLEESEVPTVIGDPAGVVVAGEGGLTNAYPGGLDLGGFELAVPQASIGALWGTRAIVRYFALEIGDSEIGKLKYVGYGAQHSISQWIPSLPVDLAAGFFIQNFDIGDELMRSTTYQFALTASRRYGVLQPYAGFGYDSIVTDVDSANEEDPESSVEATLERENTPHLTLGVMAQIPSVAVFFEFNTAIGSGFALGLDFGM